MAANLVYEWSVESADIAGAGPCKLQRWRLRPPGGQSETLAASPNGKANVIMATRQFKDGGVDEVRVIRIHTIQR